MILYLEIEHNQSENKQVSVNGLKLCMENDTVINVIWDLAQSAYKDGKTTLKMTGIHINSTMDELIKDLKAVKLDFECQVGEETSVLISDIYLTVVDCGKAQGFRFFKYGKLMYKTCLEV